MGAEDLKYAPTDWDRVQKLGVFSDVADAKEYARRTGLGIVQASKLLSSQADVVPSADLLKALHICAFGEVHPWAGKFRKPGQEVQAGTLICSDAKDIVHDLRVINREMSRYPIKGSREHVAEIIAYYHAALIAIHPFLDGNGRVGRLIMAHQMERFLGLGLDRPLVRGEYITALRRATDAGDLKPLSKYILKYGREVGMEKELEKEITQKRKIADTALPSERQRLVKKERELVKERRALGFVGSDVDEQYGLGGFPKPMTMTEALKRADDSVPWYLTADEALVMAKGIIAEDQAICAKRKLVQESLLAVRSELCRQVGLEEGLQIKKSQGQGRTLAKS